MPEGLAWPGVAVAVLGLLHSIAHTRGFCVGRSQPVLESLRTSAGTGRACPAYSAGNGSSAIRRTVAANSRLVRRLSANKNQFWSITANVLSPKAGSLKQAAFSVPIPLSWRNGLFPPGTRLPASRAFRTAAAALPKPAVESHWHRILNSGALLICRRHSLPVAPPRHSRPRRAPFRCHQGTRSAASYRRRPGPLQTWLRRFPWGSVS